MAIRIEANGIFIKDRHIPFYAGSVHYWRHSVDAWKPLLEQVKGLGFDIVSTDVPWGIHEAGFSTFDFGSRDPSKNLAAFIDTCRECNLYVILRLGPFHDVDLPWAGLPNRIAQNSSSWALTYSGSPALMDAFPRPFPVPSLASEKIFQEFAKFLDVLCPQIKNRQDPDGPIILCQAGATLGLFHREKTYDIDYSADSVCFYRTFLMEKYNSVDAMNAVYGTRYMVFSEAVPPRSCSAATFKDLPLYLDWVECKEALASNSVRRIIPLLRDRGIHVPLYHAAEPVTSPVDHQRLAAAPEAEFLSLRLKYMPGRFRDYINRARYMSGTHRFPCATDFPAGARWSSSFLPTPAEQEFLILSAIMFGISGFHFQMIAEREGWTGSPITRDGRERDEYTAMFKKLRQFLTDSHVLEGKKVARALILLNYDMERYHLAVSGFDDAFLGLIHVPRQFLEISHHFDFAQAPYNQSIRYPGRNWLSDLLQLLESRQIEFNISDTHASMEVLAMYDTIFLPMCDFIAQADFEKLIEFVERGGHLIMGPGQPVLNGQFQPLITSKYQKLNLPGTVPAGLGELSWHPEVAPVEKILSAAIQNKVLHDNPELHLAVHEGPRHLIFLANSTRQRQTATLVSPWTLRGVWNLPDQRYEGSFPVEINPFSVQVWEVVQ